MAEFGLGALAKKVDEAASESEPVADGPSHARSRSVARALLQVHAGLPLTAIGEDADTDADPEVDSDALDTSEHPDLDGIDGKDSKALTKGKEKDKRKGKEEVDQRDEPDHESTFDFLCFAISLHIMAGKPESKGAKGQSPAKKGALVP